MAKKNTLQDLTEYLKQKPHTFGEQPEADKVLPEINLNFSSKEDLIKAVTELAEKENRLPSELMTIVMIEFLEKKETLSVTEQMLMNFLLYGQLFDSMKNEFKNPEK